MKLKIELSTTVILTGELKNVERAGRRALRGCVTALKIEPSGVVNLTIRRTFKSWMSRLLPWWARQATGESIGDGENLPN